MLADSLLRQFAETGFLAVESVFTPAEVEEMRVLLDALYARFAQLPAGIRRDLTAQERPDDATLRTPEIEQPSRLDPRLKCSAVYRKVRAIAMQFGGPTMGFGFDHLIYKTPNNELELAWHQDQAYTGIPQPKKSVHFWIPLQDVTVESGCMMFASGSHRGGLVSHARRPNGHTLAATGAGNFDAVACPLKVGGLTMHTPLTLHRTGPNTTAALRRAWIIQFCPWGRFAKWHVPTIVGRMLESWRGATVPVRTGAHPVIKGGR